MITAMKVKGLLIDGERACALTHYDLQPPSDIYFDTAPYPK
jgi:hypothetical protein